MTTTGWPTKFLRRFVGGFLSTVKFILGLLALNIWDAYYTFLAWFAPYRPKGRVIPAGKPGYRGIWPEYRPPGKGDSRSPCTGLNTLANHGIIPRDGKRLKYKDVIEGLTHAYNISPPLATVLTESAKAFDNGRGYFDLSDLNCHNVIEHDASLTRPDIALWPDQSKPDPESIEYFLSHASAPGRLTYEDFVYFSGKRRVECKRENGQYSLDSIIKRYFSSGNTASMCAVFGGVVEDMRIWLLEERFPDGWEPKSREWGGRSLFIHRTFSLILEFGINEKNIGPPPAKQKI